MQSKFMAKCSKTGEIFFFSKSYGFEGRETPHWYQYKSDEGGFLVHVGTLTKDCITNRFETL